MDLGTRALFLVSALLPVHAQFRMHVSPSNTGPTAVRGPAASALGQRLGLPADVLTGSPAQALTEKFKDEVSSLSGDALKEQCQQLESARERGEHKWLEDQGIWEHLSKMCAALKNLHQNPKMAARLAQRGQAVGGRVAESMKEKLGAALGANQRQGQSPQDMAGKSLALGCTALLKAKDDGKMEWFESQGWYKKAMQMCTSLSGSSPMQMEQHMPEKTTGKWAPAMGALQGMSPVELLKHTCGSYAAVTAAVRQKMMHSCTPTNPSGCWFSQAEHMCATVQSSSPDDLHELIERQQHSAETASGQLIKETCENFDNQKRMGNVRNSQEEVPWIAAMSRLCSRLGTKKVDFVDMQQKCKWLEQLQQSGKEKVYQQQVWYKRYESACAYLKRGVAPPQEGATVLV